MFVLHGIRPFTGAFLVCRKMATSNTLKNHCQSLQTNTIQSQQTQQLQLQQSQNVNNYETLDKSSSNTLKRNPKMEFSKADLLKLLSYLEGELQARDIVIATLKSEKVKQLLTQGRYRPLILNEPLAALQRDNFAAVNTKVDEAQICSLAEHQFNSLEHLVLQQRRAQIRIARVLKDAELRHRKVIQELVEEKRKHEHDTAQGDDITYGLEKERTRLKQELEIERQTKKRLEKEMKKLTDIAEEEKNRQKQIVLLLLAERKKIIMKYVEERKRSEDLAQILTEEKSRMDSMAEGLEEESKKSLQMEAELEKQLAHFDSESQQLKASLSKEEKRAKELETELERSKGEVASLEKQLAEAHQVAMFQANANLGTLVHPRAPPPPSKPQTSPRLTPPGKSSVWVEGTVEGGTPMMSVAKVVQPTATVSSVPVCGPTTGIARSVSPGQSLRCIAVAFPTATTASPISAEMEKRTVAAAAVVAGGTAAGVPAVMGAPRVAAPSTKLFPGPAKVPFIGTAPDAKKQPPLVRGAPPPVPPNKPVVPPKKDTILCRRGDATVPSDDPKSSPQTLKYGISNKEKKVVHTGGSTGEQVGDSATLHEVSAQIEDLEFSIDQLMLNSSS